MCQISYNFQFIKNNAIPLRKYEIVWSNHEKSLLISEPMHVQNYIYNGHFCKPLPKFWTFVPVVHCLFLCLFVCFFLCFFCVCLFVFVFVFFSFPQGGAHVFNVTGWVTYGCKQVCAADIGNIMKIGYYGNVNYSVIFLQDIEHRNL